MGGQTATAVARIARRQHGIVTRPQLLLAGLSARQIERRVANGTLITVHRGVYRVGHGAPNVLADYMAAVLACPAGAVLCGLAGAHLLGIVRDRPPRAEVLTTGRSALAGARRTRRLDRRDLTRWRGIPVTTPARTLVDLAAALALPDLARACHEAGVRHHTTPRQVGAVLARRANAPGAAKFAPIFDGDSPAVLSWMEDRALALIGAARLPRPEVNRRRGAHYLDLRWPDHRLTVELVSYRFHHSRHAWEADHERRRIARRRGDEFRSYSYEDVVEGRAMVEELGALLHRP
jgi:hypothetical protein